MSADVDLSELIGSSVPVTLCITDSPLIRFTTHPEVLHSVRTDDRF